MSPSKVKRLVCDCGLSGGHSHSERPLRILQYSHDSLGLGHLRRSLSIARAITCHFERANALVVTGSPCATQFELPDRCDVLKLPAVSKDPDGAYRSRTLSNGIGAMIELRSRLILESFRAFDPHLVIVDHQLTGLHHEALPMLRLARQQGTKLVYGMRDVLDSAESVSRGWSEPEHAWALQEAYDAICIYGSPEVFDPRSHYPVLGPVEHKIRFTGYIAPPLIRNRHPAIPSLRRKVLVMTGGGEDGADKLERYIASLLAGPIEWDSHIVTGPMMATATVREFKRKLRRLGLADSVRLSRFYPDLLKQMQESDAVVSMAGYNSCAEMMKCGVPGVLLPRARPRKEQLIRARRLEELGLFRCLVDPDPNALRAAVIEALQCPSATRFEPDLGGLDALCDIVGQLTTPDAGTARPATQAFTPLAEPLQRRAL